MKAFLGFEYAFYFRKPWFYIGLAAIAGIGFFAGSALSFSVSPDIFRNAPYTTTQMLGLLSLICIFIATPFAAQVLFRDNESRFNLILYSTPVSKSTVLLSRFLVVAGIVFLAFTILTAGYAAAQFCKAGSTGFSSFNIRSYLSPFLKLCIPNAFFCTAIICGIAWMTRNKLLVYISGLFIYIFYMAAMLFSRSPMMAGSLPPDPAAMQASSILDPFGLSAFFQQTAGWSVTERNESQVLLKGSLLLNRILYSTLSLIVLYGGYLLADFKPRNRIGKPELKHAEIKMQGHQQIPTVKVDMGGPRYHLATIVGFVKTDLKVVFKTVSFLLILIGFAFFISMEIYSEIDKGIRLPENYASSALMANRIISAFPELCILVLLFYSSEIMWRSRMAGFDTIENATPVSPVAQILSKWFSLNMIILVLLSWLIIIGIIFQFLYSYKHIDIKLYLDLYYLTAFPLMMSAGIMVCIQTLIANRYAGLVASAIIILLTNSGMGRMIGLRDPLIRFHSAFSTRFSEMNGWGNYLNAFNLRMLFALSALLLITGLVLIFKGVLSNRLQKLFLIALVPVLALMVLTGFSFKKKSIALSKQELLSWQENYERKYKKFWELPQPVVTDVDAAIELFPEKDRYNVTGFYIVQNKTEKPIDSILLYVKNELEFNADQTISHSALMIADEKSFGHYWYRLTKSLLPGDTMTIRFSFSYRWTGFVPHDPFNSILRNGSFMRISRYFPAFGYQQDNEITDQNERSMRRLALQQTTMKLDSPRKMEHDFIRLNLVVSTNAEQKAIGIGESVNTWTKENRNYFRYVCNEPIPFRFAISSAEYEVFDSTYEGRNIEIYYHPAHKENVGHLFENVKKTLDYCELNFSPYPFKTIRFAEISAFTRGFAATAYPATIFMTEDMVFHSNIKGDKQQDVINELAGHELAHTWWGNKGIVPDVREGCTILTETLAMYTEMMLVKKMYGNNRLIENVRMHTGIYLDGRGYGTEKALIYSDPEDRHLSYSKGTVVMYQLANLIGEEKINLALKNLLQKFRYPAPVPIASDLLTELRAVSDSSVSGRIDDLFSHVITYEFRLKNKSVTKSGNGYRLALSIEAEKINGDNGKISKSVFSDSLGIAIISGDKVKYVIVSVVNGTGVIQSEIDFKPEKLLFDPNEMFLKSNSSNSVTLQ